MHLEPVTPKVPLTPVERETLLLLAAGQTAKQAARSRGVSPYTINQTLELIRIKLGATNTVAAVASAFRQGLIS